MKLVNFGHPARIGALTAGDLLVDLNLAYAARAAREEGETRPYAKADAFLPANLLAFLTAGRPAIDAARQVIGYLAAHPGIAGPSGEAITCKSSAVKIGAPLPSMGTRIFCGGGNYVRHLSGVRALWKGQNQSDEEWVRFIREKPFWGFYKLPQTVVGPEAPVHIPGWVQAFDYEIEIAAFVGKEGKNVSREEAAEMIVGYSVLNDWCIRDPHLIIGAEDFDEGVLSFAWQKNASGASLGPYLSIDEIADPNTLKMETKVNGQLRQSGVTGEMVFKLDEIVAYISKYVTLYPGDIITPGTCAGTAFDSSRLLPESEWRRGKLKVDNALFLKDKDLVEGSIEGLGVLRNQMVADLRNR
jgi:2-keto-4-pentenoate hydratase/2-oxohepta-3-ene-1,7-dioic acid hydratase in catechol pathway